MMTPLSLPISDFVDFSVIQQQSTFMQAVNLCISAAGREPKQAYIELGIDKGQWSRIQGGQAHFPHEKLVILMDVMGNDIPLQWLAWRRGKGLHLLESEQQRLIREKDELLARKNIEIEALQTAIRGKAG